MRAIVMCLAVGATLVVAAFIAIVAAPVARVAGAHKGRPYG
jgi:hypothetical protein